MLLNPIHINQSETDVNVSDINKWANSRDPEGTAAWGKGDKGTSLLSHEFYKEGLYFCTVPRFAFLVVTDKSKDGCLFGKGRMISSPFSKSGGL